MSTTVLITGASRGIGKEFARQFASHGHHVILVARDEKSLQNLATEISKKYKVNATVLARDLSNINDAENIYTHLKVHGIKVDYLVNNAGFGDYAFFQNEDWKRIEGMICVNLTALTRLCHLFVQDMVSEKNGKIMNVASTAAFLPGPLMAVYFATKAYVLSLSEALSNELEGTGVSVTCLCPGATASNFKKTAKVSSSFYKGNIPTSTEVAAYGYKSMMKNKRVAIHGLTNKLLIWGSGFVPRSIILKVVRYLQTK